jgi:uncharacterized protein (TIGR02284 family)
MERSEVIATLNGLLATINEVEDGYLNCAEQVKRADVQALLDRAAKFYQDRSAVLNATIKGLGGEADASESLTGTLHLAWIDMMSSIVDMDDDAILAECERGEAAIKAAYEALAQDLPGPIRQMVEQQFERVKHDDEIRGLRDALWKAGEQG